VGTDYTSSTCKAGASLIFAFRILQHNHNMDINSDILLLQLGRNTYRILLNLQEQTQVSRGRCLVNAILVRMDFK
jgi:hypothetical protein